MEAMRGESVAIANIMANSGIGPLVVHCPDDGLAAHDDFPDVCQGEKTLVHPTEMNHVGLLKLAQAGDVKTGIGNVDLEKMFLREMQFAEDGQPFPEEMPTGAERGIQTHYGQRVALLVANEHLRLDTIVVERLYSLSVLS